VDCSPERLQRALDILRARGDRDQGAGVLWRCLYRQLLSWFLRYSRNSPESEDITQTAFLKVLQMGARCPADITGFKAYFRTVMKNTYIDILKRRRKWRSFEEEPTVAEECLLSPPSQEEEALRQERVQKVKEALDRLSPGQRFCIMLHYQGWKPKEIARLRGCKEGTVKALLHQGRSRLRLLLEGDFDDFDIREE
jgi:RNA polymerase sigma-70 factor, ECF subfamily